MDRFGEKLRWLRTSRGLTLKVLAERLGYSAYTYLSELESGKKTPTAKFVLKVALFFNVTTDELLRDDYEVGSRGEEE